MTKDQIKNILLLGESQLVEFKTNFNKEVIESIVAFSNTNGGKIILGIKDDKKIIGVTISDESIQKWLNEIKQNTIPSIVPSINTVQFENKTLVVISVQEFPVKPVSCKDRYFIRKSNSNHKLSVDEIAEIRFISLSYSFDSFVVNTTYEELDANALAFFKNRLLESGRYKYSGDLKFDLKKLGIIKDDKLTRAAELLFGNHHTNIHLGRFKSQTTIIDDLLIRSPLILAVEEAIDFIKKNIRLEFEFGGSGLKRKEKWQYPIPAIRELLLNAIVHRDYSNPTDVIVKIFDDSMEITNPGHLMGGLTLADLKTDDYISVHRNKLLTEVFYLTGDIEKYGTGFKRLRNWFSKYKNISFEIKDSTDFIRIKVNEIKNILDNDTDKVPDKVPDKVSDKVPDKVPDSMTENQQKILKLIEQNKMISMSQLAENIGISKRKVLDNINKLKSKGVITRQGKAKGGYWEVFQK